MKFILPCPEYEERAADFLAEFGGDHVNGTGGLDRYLKNDSSGEGYRAWLQKVAADMDLANIPEGRAPAFTYFYVREEDGAIIGMINLRLTLTDFLRRECGHIGYSIRPAERRQGHGTRMLREALRFFQPIVNTDVIITCGRDNAASAGVIKNCGGVLDAEFYSETFDEVIRRYRIPLPEPSAISAL